MKEIYVFNDEGYETHEEAIKAAMYFAHETFDNYLDECYGEVRIGGSSYPTSYVLKRINETDYRTVFCDYANSLYEKVKIDEFDDDDEEDEDE